MCGRQEARRRRLADRHLHGQRPPANTRQRRKVPPDVRRRRAQVKTVEPHFPDQIVSVPQACQHLRLRPHIRFRDRQPQAERGQMIDGRGERLLQRLAGTERAGQKRVSSRRRLGWAGPLRARQQRTGDGERRRGQSCGNETQPQTVGPSTREQ